MRSLPEPLPSSTSCATCAAPLAADQRYCLECGERSGPPRLDPLEVAHERSVPVVAAGPADVVEPAGVGGLSVPGPRVAALLTLAMLVGGIALGAASGDRTATSAAATAKRYVLVGGPPTLAALPAPAVPTPPTVAAPEEATPDVVAPEPATAPPVAAETPVAPVTADPAPAASAPADTSASEDTTPAPAPTPIPAAAPKLPPVKHVWVVALADRKLTETFGPGSSDPYVRDVLVRQGVLLNNFHATSGGAPADGIALISGQGANPATEGDCATPADITPGTTEGEQQQVAGTGCEYPGTVGTLPDQLVGAGLTWKAYVEDVAPGKLSATPSCEGTRTPRNPFAYFKGITSDGQCPQRIVGTDALAPDLADPITTPSFSYIVPNACHDGSDVPCAEGAPAGLAAASPWLQGVLGQIQASKAYQDDGLIVVLADRSGPDGPTADRTARKGGPAPAGGGLVPALLLSKFVTPGQQVAAAYDHFSLLRTVEDLFALPRLGEAGAPGAKGFGPRVFGAYAPPAR
jgi:phosphatidylinositol-3-phosphatase